MKQLRLTFGFFTILPLSKAGSITEVAEAGYLLPLVAAVLGGAGGLAGWGLAELFGPALAAALVLALLLLFTGFHHVDGLADVTDAIMAGGDKARRLKVLKDKTTGVGAVAALVLVYLISWAALLEVMPAWDMSRLPWLLMTIEISGRLCLLTVIVLSQPSHPGSGSVFLTALRGYKGALAIAISAVFLAALAVPLGYGTPLACGVTAVAAGLLMTISGKRLFGGANGDLLGASVELGRMAALIAAAVVVS